jgi:hypothetical protein
MSIAIGNEAWKDSAKAKASSDVTHNLDVALKWAAAGAHVFVTNLGKRARVKWRNESTTDPATITGWFDQWPDSLPAIDLGKSNIVVIDGDRHGGPDGVAATERIFAQYKLNAAVIPTVISPQNGKHFWFLQPTDAEPLGNSDKSVRDQGINVRGNGGYVIAPGARLPDGRQYRRDPKTLGTMEAFCDGTIPVLPPSLVKLLRPNGHYTSPQITNGHDRGVREEAYAQAALDNIGRELAKATPGGRNIELNNAALKMGHMVAAGWIGRAIVEGRLFDAATACGLTKDDGAHRARATIKSGLDAGEKVPHAPLPKRPLNGKEWHSAPEEHSQPQQHEYIKFRLTAFKDIKVNTTRRSYLVKGLLASTGLAVIWGPPKCYKSFWATDIGLHFALGWPYRDRRVVQTTVCYIALEGQYGFAARIEVFRKHHNIAAETEVPFHLITTPLDLIHEADRLIVEIKTQLGDKCPGLVFIDTLNRSLVGSESKDEDMAAYLRAAEKIEQSFNCTVAIVHHCGVDASRPRGHTSQTGAVESQIAVKKLSKLSVGVKVEVAKDFEEGAEITSRLEVVDTGLVDPDGDAIASLVVLPVEGPTVPMPTTKKKLSLQNGIALEALREAIVEGGTPAKTSRAPHGAAASTFDDWLRYYDAKTAGDIQPDSKRRALERARNKLQYDKIIGVWRDEIWIA